VICQGQTYTVGISVYTASGTYTDVLQTYQGCDSTVTLNLMVNPTQSTTLNEVICQGQTYTVGTSVYAASGTYTDVLQTYQGCDSTVTLNLMVNPTQSTTLNEVICQGESYTVGTSVYTITGNYTDVLQTYQGCDSTVTLNLMVNPTKSTTLNEVICQGQTYTVGISVYTASGTYIDVLQTYQGCDSTVTLNLMVNPTKSTTLNEVICQGQSYTVGTSVYTITGNYTDVLQTYQGCDSTVTLNLMVNPTKSTTLNEVICQGQTYTVGTSVYAASGTYTDVLQTYQGCDSTVTLNLMVNPTQSTTLNEVICQGESYTVGTSVYTITGNYTDVLQTYQGCDSTVRLNLMVNPIQSTTLNEVICQGQTYTVGTSVYTASGTYTDVLQTYQGCDSTVTLNLMVNPTQSTTLNEVICQGQSYMVGTSVYTITGNYTDVLQTYQGCDSTVTLNLMVNPTKSTTLNEVICQGQSYMVGTSVYTITGNYTDVLQTYQGCDSTVTLNLMVNPTKSITLNEVICQGQSYMVGTSVYTITGNYTDVLQTYQGCDSTITLNLIVNPTQSTTLNEVICQGESYTVGTSVYTITGNYTDVLQTYQGCDSTVTLNLMVNPTQSTTLNEVICQGQSYTVGTSVYTTSGTQTDILQTWQGCDSTITLNLIVNPIQNTILNEVICQGQTYTVGTSVYTTSGIQTDILQTWQGCDSTITLNLIVNPIQNTTLNEVICQGESYTVGTSVYTASGTYTDVLQTYQGCDSTVTLNLMVNPTQSTTLNEVICQGQSYTVGTSVYTASGTYTDVLQTYQGCDSTVTLNLIVNPAQNTTLNEVICQGQSYTVGTSVYTITGTYTDVLQTYQGCDSTVTLNLMVNPTQSTTLNEVICQGESYTVGTSVYTITGTYTDVLQTYQGCDSTVTLNLMVNPTQSTTLNEVICQGESYTVGTSVYTASGTYTDVLQTYQGCDSTVTLNLMVNPTQSTTLNEVICQGQSYTVGTSVYTASGTYTDVLQTYQGCDSTVTLNLNVLPLPNNPIVSLSGNSVFCQGEQVDLISTYSFGNYWNIGDTTQSITSNSTNDYWVYHIDQFGCVSPNSDTISIIVNQNPQIDSIVITQEISCFGENDGVLNVGASNGLMPYVYEWNNGEQTAINDSLISGWYVVTVTDNNTCFDIDSIFLAEPTSLTAQIIPLSNYNGYGVSCNGGNDGSLQIVPSGGTMPYGILWNNGNTTNVIQNLIAGIYTATVTDIKGCTYIISDTITAPTVLSSNTNTTSNFNGYAVSCYDSNDGTATTMAQGGVGGYQYAWSNGQNTSNASGLSSGKYYVTVTDINGCNLLDSIDLNAPDSLISIIQTTDNLCFGDSNGTASIIINGGVGAYTYDWDNGSVNDSISGLSSGIYLVTATDANGCSIIDTASIEEPLPLSLSIGNTNVSCFGGNDGNATIIPSGGIAPYTYDWSTGDSTSSVNLSAGTYQVTVTDNQGCHILSNINISQPLMLQLAGNSTLVSCYGGNDGTAAVTATGGTIPYTYNWDSNANNQTNNTANNLSAGIYTVSVTDNQGCMDTIAIQVLEPNAIQITFNSTNITCFGLSDGIVTAQVNGGNSPYTYNWNNGETTPIIQGLSIGSYIVTVEDANNCFAIDTVVVQQPNPLTITDSVINMSCNNGNNGQITIQPNGGTTPYSYTWFGLSDTTAIVNNLSVGMYYYNVTDANNCLSEDSVVLSEPSVLVANLFPNLIYCSGVNSGRITPYISGGIYPYTYNWSNNSIDSILTNVYLGTYYLTITDANGCTFVDSATIDSHILDAYLVINPTSCNANMGSIMTNVGYGIPPYSYQWNNGQTTQNLQGLSGGTYTVTITDQLGCTIVRTGVVNQPSSPSFQAIITNICQNTNSGAIDLTTTSGQPTFQFLWNDGVTTEDRINLSVGTYQVTATDANGCFTVGTYDVNYFAPMTLGFSRQDDCGDGISWLSTFIQGGGTAPFNYAWSSGDTTAQTGFLPHGNYTVTVTDSKSCSVASSQLPIFDKEPNAAFGYSSSANDISFFDSLSYPADSETWDFGDGNSSNSANPNHTYADTGYYNVTHIICIDDCGCDTLMMTIYVDGSITSTIVVAGIQNIELYPNPNNGLFTVDWQGIQIRNIKIWSVDGRLVYNRNIDNQVSQNIDMSKTATGVYIVQLEDVDGWIISRKVLVE
jgi:hypothetical protein